ncbi:MAG: hypothetical protein GY834_05345 [Bacteroidetes bacterium]|nr:hypothetical protein [Bacteroidota bacterium]
MSIKKRKNSSFFDRLKEVLIKEALKEVSDERKVATYWAEKIEVTSTVIRSKWFKGESYPCADSLIKIFELIDDLSGRWLLLGQGPMYITPQGRGQQQKKEPMTIYQALDILSREPNLEKYPFMFQALVEFKNNDVKAAIKTITDGLKEIDTSVKKVRAINRKVG